MRVILGAVIVLAGCAADSQPHPMPPEGCLQHVTLDAGPSGSPTTIGPVAIDSAGVTVCMRIVAPPFSPSHFGAQTQPVAGNESPFDAVLVDSHGTTLRAGWDVMISTTDPTVFTNVEWDPPLDSTIDAVLHVSARSTTATTMLSLSLILPID